MSEKPDVTEAVDPRIIELDARLRELVRRKYQEHWRHKDGRPIAQAELSKYNALQGEIKNLFDEIRLLDKKYQLPVFELHG